MRYLVALMTLCCGATVGYADEPAEQPEDVAIIVDEPSSDNEEVASSAGVDSKKSDKPRRGGCGCGK